MMDSEIFVRAMIFALGLCGFFVARYIYGHKRAGSPPLVCPIRFDCRAVVHSNYSRLFGVPLEIFGMLYYGLVAIGYFTLLFLPEVMPGDLVLALVIVSSLAFLFSLYLIVVQIFILKKGCSWCIVSALICLLIFLLTFSIYDLSILEFIQLD